MGKSVSESRLLIKEREKLYAHLMVEYELVKAKKHALFKSATDFYTAHKIHRQTFLKYYHRFVQSGRELASLQPQKRGPKYNTRRASASVEEAVIELRLKGMNRYEIAHTLNPILNDAAPSASGVYTILRRHNMNVLTPKIKQEKRRIIKMKAGELGHIDAYSVRKTYVPGIEGPVYLVALVDDCTRIALCEITRDIKSLTVMFATLRMINMMNDIFGIKYAEIITDNGPEFGRGDGKNKENHPFERMLLELGIKHRYTRPYRPQTNGKVERFWRTLKEDMLDEVEYNSISELQDELSKYLAYYNIERPHQGIKGVTPKAKLESVDRVS